jgi:hypothetical protein
VRSMTSAEVLDRARTRFTSSCPRSAYCRMTCGWPSEDLTSSRPATASSSWAVWSDQATSSACLRCATTRANGFAQPNAASPTSGRANQAAGQVSPATTQARTERSTAAAASPAAAPQEVARLRRVVVHPVDHLTDRLLVEHRQRLVQRGVQEVGAQSALGPPDDPGEQGRADGVEDRRADEQGGEQQDECAGGVDGELPGDDRARDVAHGRDRSKGGCRHRRPDAEAAPAQRLCPPVPGSPSSRRCAGMVEIFARHGSSAAPLTSFHFLGRRCGQRSAGQLLEEMLSDQALFSPAAWRRPRRRRPPAWEVRPPSPRLRWLPCAPDRPPRGGRPSRPARPARGGPPTVQGRRRRPP